MTPSERFARLHAIFDEAREVAGPARDQVLHERCGSDAGLRQEVEELLLALEREGSDALSDDEIDASREALDQLIAEPGASWVPDRVGPYRVLRRVAEGGMGVVYEAEQESPRRRIALKVVHPMFVTETRLKRFRQEAELLGRLRHAGIAQIYEAGSYDLGRGSQPYFAMEFVEGLDLARHAHEAQLPLRARIELLAKVCDAVEHAHKMGVIHRDLKPDNVLVDAHGQPKVLDFGVARAAEGSTVLTTLVTEEGDLLGTIAYMAPEQLAGQPDAITTRADVYALGVIAFELLVGRLPHDLVGLPLAAAIQIARDQEPDRLGTLRPALKGDVETIVGKALEKEPGRRYASAADLAADLRAFLENRPIAARPPSRIYRAAQFTRRNKALVGGTVTTFVAIVVGLVATLIFAFRAEDNAVEAAENADRAREGERRAVAGLMQSTQDFLERGELWKAAYLFRRVVGRNRGWEVELLGRALPKVLPEQYGAHSAAWADANHLFVGMPDGAVVLEVESWREVRRYDEPVYVSKVGRYPRQIEAREHARGFDGFLIDPWTGERTSAFSEPLAEGESRYTYRDDQGRIWGTRKFIEDAALGLRAGTSSLVEWIIHHEGREVFRLQGAGLFGFPFVSPDGRRIVDLRDDDGELSLHDLESGEVLGELQGLVQSSCARAYFPPNRSVVFLYDADERLISVDLETGQVLQRYTSFTGDPCSGGDLSPDGTRFAHASEGSVEIIELAKDRIEFSQEIDLQGASGSNVNYSADGRRLLVFAEGIASCIVEVTRELDRPETFGTDEDPRALTYRGHRGFLQDFAVAPDGRMVASLSPPDELIRIWDSVTGETIATIRKPRGVTWVTGWDRGYQVAFAPDGRLVATVREGLQRPELCTADLVTGEVTFEELDPDLPTLSILPMLDRFLEVLGPAPPMRLGRKVALLEDGTGLAVQEPAGGQVPEGLRWRAFVDDNGEDAFCLSPDGDRAVITNYQFLRLFERETEQEIARVIGGARSVDWSPDGRLIAAGTQDGRIRLIDAELFAELYTFRAHSDVVIALAWMPDGERLVSASLDGRLRVWDPRSGEERAEARRGYDQRIAALRELDDDELRRRLEAATTVENRFELLRVLMERRERGGAIPSPRQATLDLLAKGDLARAREHFAARDKARDGWETKLLARALSNDPPTGSSVARPVPANAYATDDDPWVTTYRGHEIYVYVLAVSPDGRLIASASVMEPFVKVWDAATGQTLATLPKPVAKSPTVDNRGQLLAFSPDGRRLLATARDGLLNPELFVYDLLTGAERSEPLPQGLSSASHLSWLDRYVEELGAAPSMRLGRKAFLLNDGTAIAIHPAETGREVATGERWSIFEPVRLGEGLAVSPDETKTAVSTSGSIRIYGSEGASLARLFGQAYGLAWSPDGRRLAAGDEAGDVRFFDGESFEELLRFRAHDDYVFSLAWTPDGSRLVTASGDETLRVWDVRPPRERETDYAAYEQAFTALIESDASDLSIRFDSATTTSERGAVIRAALEQRQQEE